MDQKLEHVGKRPIRPDGVDKVTGRAKFGADFNLPGQLYGRILRSPHPHARLVSIDTSEAEKLAGVKAIVTRDDFNDQEMKLVPAGELMVNYHDLVRNIMAREKVLYQGHAVAAVAATRVSIARKALKLIKVNYEILPHVLDVEEAMSENAPLLHDWMYTVGVEPKPEKPSNIAKRVEFGHGDVDKGFAEADVVIERTFNTQPVHQGYIEPHACIASMSEDGQSEVWCTTQGHFQVRGFCADLLGLDQSSIRVTASEIGGGFGGKTAVYLEPVALALSRKSSRPVKLVMSRSEVFLASGPAPGAKVQVKIGATNDGKITAGQAILKYQAGGFQGAPVQPGAMCAFAPYDLPNVQAIGFDVVTNRPKTAAYRAPGAPISEYAVESVIDEVAKKLDIDPIDFRLKNAAREGSKSSYGPKFGPIGLVQTLEKAKGHDHYQAPLGKDQGRGVASGFWFNAGGDTCVNLTINSDGTATVVVGTPDIGGSRASMAMMAAEELNLPLDKVKAVIGDTAALGFNFVTGGSRATFASGMATVNAARAAKAEMCRRAAKIWDIAEEAVEWADGGVKPAGENAGKFEPMTLKELAALAPKTGGPIVGVSQINAQGAAPSFGTHIVDLEVDRETGRVTILRYTVLQDAGRAIHPAYVEGQFQGGAAQGIGWALNEEYIYNKDGLLENPNFLDYRIPVASDLPMIDTVIVEEPNPRHPYGVRGVGETPIVPPMAAIANALENALGIRFTNLPMSPPKVLAALDA